MIIDKARSVSLGGGYGNNTRTNEQQSGSLSFGYSSRDVEQVTKATIGQGAINIANNSDISSLNRDITKSQEITKYQVVDEVSGSYKFFSEDQKRQQDFNEDGTRKTFEQKARQWLRPDKTIIGSVASVAAANGNLELANSINDGQKLINQYGGDLVENSTIFIAGNFLGAIPTDKNHGGLLTQALAMFTGDQSNIRVEMSDETRIKIAEANKKKEKYEVFTNSDGEKLIRFKDETTAELKINVTDLDDFNVNLSKEVTQGEGTLLSDLKTNKDNSFNGIFNSEDEAINNGLMQMGVLQSNVLNVNYDPTHGLLPDGIEVAWNWLSGKTPFKSGNLYELSTYGKNIAAAAKSYNISGLRMVGHSGGGDRLYQGVLYSADKGAFKKTNLQVQFYGSPLRSEKMRDIAGLAGIDNFQDIKHQINPGDYVGENLGWRNSSNTADKILGPLNPLAVVTKLPQLFTDSSPHSNYFCEGDFCGYDKINSSNK